MSLHGKVAIVTGRRRGSAGQLPSHWRKPGLILWLPILIRAGRRTRWQRWSSGAQGAERQSECGRSR